MPELTYAEEAAPDEITAVLHDLIAAQSPEHAALVADFKRWQADGQRPPGPRQVFPRAPAVSRLCRLAQYAALRAAGTGKKAAATQVGISRRTGVRDEAAMNGDRT